MSIILFSAWRSEQGIYQQTNTILEFWYLGTSIYELRAVILILRTQIFDQHFSVDDEIRRQREEQFWDILGGQYRLDG